MNRQRFLAELSQLLSFMAEHDRAALLKELSARFDEAGPEGESALISQLGTPTALAIKTSHGYKPSEAPAPEAENTEKPEEAAEVGEAAEAEEPAEAAAVQAEPETETEPGPEVVTAEEPEEAQPQAEMPTAPDLAQLFGGPAPTAEPDDKPEKPARPRGRAALITLTVSGGILLAAVILAVAAVVLAPGVAGVCGAALFGLAGLWASSVITDALFLFGIALIALAVGVLLLFLAIWLLVCIIKPLVSGIAELFKLTGGEGK